MTNPTPFAVSIDVEGERAVMIELQKLGDAAAKLQRVANQLTKRLSRVLPGGDLPPPQIEKAAGGGGGNVPSPPSFVTSAIADVSATIAVVSNQLSELDAQVEL